jgi:hypothetical protein
MSCPIVLVHGAFAEADRAGARCTLEIAGASHAAAVSQPGAVVELILEAARLPTAA